MRTCGWASLLLLWAVAVGSLSLGFSRYKATPGDPGDLPLRWPEASALVHASDRPTLILWAHPRCPCTRASLAELARLAAVLDGRALVEVVFLLPETDATDWKSSDLVATARAIPGVEVVYDPAQREATLFGAATSGNVALYGPAGDLWFSGGITPARGHQGDSAGRAAILARVLGDASTPAATPIFGCGLLETP